MFRDPNAGTDRSIVRMDRSWSSRLPHPSSAQSNKVLQGAEDKCVVPILGWHLPAGESLFPDDPRERTEPTPSLGRGQRFPYILVMKRGRQSCHHAVQSRRFAGIDIPVVRRMAWKLARCLRGLHGRGIIHGDVKPRNVLIYDDNRIVLCDLDASMKNGAERVLGKKMPSSGYSAPEVERFKIWEGLPEGQRGAKPALRTSAALDVWGFGVVLFQLCTGEKLFHQNEADDEIVDPRDEMRKCVWNCISDDELMTVFLNGAIASEGKSRDEVLGVASDAKNLIRWCLQGDPTARPSSMKEIMEHAFFGHVPRSSPSPGAEGDGKHRDHHICATSFASKSSLRRSRATRQITVETQGNLN